MCGWHISKEGLLPHFKVATFFPPLHRSLFWFANDQASSIKSEHWFAMINRETATNKASCQSARLCIDWSCWYNVRGPFWSTACPWQSVHFSRTSLERQVCIFCAFYFQNLNQNALLCQSKRCNKSANASHVFTDVGLLVRQTAPSPRRRMIQC